MVDFTRTRKVSTRTPQIKVDPLPAGRYLFELVVTDKAGNESRPARIAVHVEKDPRRGRFRPR